jgi:hypothetical protein
LYLLPKTDLTLETTSITDPRGQSKPT